MVINALLYYRCRSMKRHVSVSKRVATNRCWLTHSSIIETCLGNMICHKLLRKIDFTTKIKMFWSWWDQYRLWTLFILLCCDKLWIKLIVRKDMVCWCSSTARNVWTAFKKKINWVISRFLFQFKKRYFRYYNVLTLLTWLQPSRTFIYTVQKKSSPQCVKFVHKTI